uniref:Uncharacterized protein n=1 Tax=Candidozyma auris TaxID=498019 RepID=A0A0L0P8L1_CANAR
MYFVTGRLRSAGPAWGLYSAQNTVGSLAQTVCFLSEHQARPLHCDPRRAHAIQVKQEGNEWRKLRECQAKMTS